MGRGKKSKDNPALMGGEGDVDLEDVEPVFNDGSGDFFGDINCVKTDLKRMAEVTRKLEQKHEAALKAMSSSQQSKVAKDVQKLMKHQGTYSLSVKGKLEGLQKMNEKFSRKKSNTAAEVRMRATMHQSVTKQFSETMREYQDMQSRCKQQYADRERRSFLVLKPSATERELEELANTQDPVQIQALVGDSESAVSRHALRDAQDRHRDMLRIEESLRDLHQLFADLAVLVEAQGELIDSIEMQAATTENYTTAATANLTVAAASQRKLRKKKCACGGIVVIILVVGVVFLVLVTSSTTSAGSSTNTNSVNG